MDLSISDESDDGQRRPQMEEDIFNDSQNETAVSFGGANDDLNNPEYDKANSIFAGFFNSNILKRKLPEDELFQNSPALRPYRKIMKIYLPEPNLYFLPTTIFLPAEVQLMELRDQLIASHREANITYISNKKSGKEYISVQIHTTEYLQVYKIKKFPRLDTKHPHPVPYLLDEEQMLAPLYCFYATNYQEKLSFNQTCSYMLYWAYCKGLLDEILTEWTIKLLVIYYYISMGKGVANIVDSFKKENAAELDKVTRMYTVNKKLNCELNEELFGQSNFTLRAKRGFYVEATKRYSQMIEIIPVPYPISESDLIKYSERVKKNYNSPNLNPLTTVFKILQYLQNQIQRASHIVIDFGSSRKAMTEVPSVNFNFEVRHPVLGTNICETLTEEFSKRRKLMGQVSAGINIEKDSKDSIQAVKRLFARV